MGFSVAKEELYYIYVLRVENNGWYVGSTKSFENRMRSHFGRGGSIATKERRVIGIEEVFELMDYQIRTDCAHERAEVIIAAKYAEIYGDAAVRGAKHGKSWKDKPSPGNLRDIERYKKFSLSPEGKILISNLKKVDYLMLLPDVLSGNLKNISKIDN